MLGVCVSVSVGFVSVRVLGYVIVGVGCLSLKKNVNSDSLMTSQKLYNCLCNRAKYLSNGTNAYPQIIAYLSMNFSLHLTHAGLDIC